MLHTSQAARLVDGSLRSHTVTGMMLQRLRSRTLVLLAAVATVLSIGISPAMAHTDVDEYLPETGAVLAQTPETLTLRFSTDPNPEVLEITLMHRNGEPVPFTGGKPTFDGRNVTVVPPALDYGTYVIVWRSVGSDGHVAVGQSHFSVGQPDSGPIADLRGGSGAGSTLLDTFSRLVVYASLSLGLGLVWLRRKRLTRDGCVDAPRGLVWLLGASVVVRLVLVATRAGGGQGLINGLTRVLTTMPTALGWVLLAGAVGVFALRRRATWTALLALLAAVIGETLTGHMATAKGALILVPLTITHLVGAAFWVGGIAAFVFFGARGAAPARRFAHAFSAPALGAVLTIALSGLALTQVRTKIDSLEGLIHVLDYRYGQVLGVKWLLIAVGVLPVALWHAMRTLSARLSPSLEAADSDADGVTAEVVDVTDVARTPRVARQRSFIIELLALVLVLGLGSSLAGLSPKPESVAERASGQDLLAAPTDFKECLSPDGVSDQLLCATRYFEGIVERDGMNAALLEVGSRWRDGDSWMQSNCHSIGHKLGRLGFKIYKDIPAAFQAGSDPCDYGYLHGVIEGASADFSDDELRAAMTSLCAGTGDATNHGYRQCIHGLGHAAARRVNNDLPRAMDFCRAFYTPPPAGATPAPAGSEGTEEVLFRLCVTGVSMEWNTQRKALDAMTLPIGAPGTLLGECLALDEIFYVGCLEYGTSALGGELKREIEARDWCDANLKDSLPCYQSIGRDVIWSPQITPQQAMEVCTGGRPGIYAEQCITRALGSVATIALDAKAIDKFCPTVPEQYRYLCPIVRDAMVVQIEQTLRGFIVEPNQESSPTENGL